MDLKSTSGPSHNSRANAEPVGARAFLTSETAHELGNRVQLLGGVLNAIKKNSEFASGDGSSLLTSAGDALEGIRAIVQSVLGVSRGGDLDHNSFELNEALESLFHTLSLVISPNIAFGLRVSPVTMTLHCDRFNFEGAIVNLVLNAADATSDGEMIILSAGPGERFESVVIEVSDSGTGMDEITQMNAFNPRFTTKAKGNGLGLAAVKEFVDLARGQTRLYSKLGEGSTIGFEIPASCSTH